MGAGQTSDRIYGRRPGCIALTLAIALLGSCAGTSSEERVATRDEVFSSPSGQPGHIVRDNDGSYFCVLRRQDDLAALRARFNPPVGQAPLPSGPPD